MSSPKRGDSDPNGSPFQLNPERILHISYILVHPGEHFHPLPTDLTHPLISTHFERIRFPLVSFSHFRGSDSNPSPSLILSRSCALAHFDSLWGTPSLILEQVQPWMRLPPSPPLISSSPGSPQRIRLFPSLLLISKRILLPPHLFSSIPTHVSLTSFPAGSRVRRRTWPFSALGVPPISSFSFTHLFLIIFECFSACIFRALCYLICLPCSVHFPGRFRSS